jgi:hypothetical protein
MPTTNPPEQDTPPRPTEAVNRHDFGRPLRALRTWSELTQKDPERRRLGPSRRVMGLVGVVRVGSLLRP